ncbi:Helitron helicase, partial [Phytophthora megakarya]
FDNPRCNKSIRVYNNVFAFTSIGASDTNALNVNDCVTRDGVCNFRVQETVCRRMGSLLTSPNIRNNRWIRGDGKLFQCGRHCITNASRTLRR